MAEGETSQETSTKQQILQEFNNKCALIINNQDEAASDRYNIFGIQFGLTKKRSDATNELNPKNMNETNRLHQEYERLKHEFDTAQIQRHEIQKRYETLSNEYEVMKSDLEQTHNDKIKAEKKINEMEAKLSTIAQEKDNIDTQYGALLTQHEQITNDSQSINEYVEKIETLNKEKRDIVAQYERYRTAVEQTQIQLTKQLEQITIGNEQIQRKNDEFIASKQSYNSHDDQVIKPVENEEEEDIALTPDYKDIEQHLHDLQTEYKVKVKVNANSSDLQMETLFAQINESQHINTAQLLRIHELEASNKRLADQMAVIVKLAQQSVLGSDPAVDANQNDNYSSDDDGAYSTDSSHLPETEKQEIERMKSMKSVKSAINRKHACNFAKSDSNLFRSSSPSVWAPNKLMSLESEMKQQMEELTKINSEKEALRITQERDEWLKKYNDLCKIHEETQVHVQINEELTTLRDECEQLRQKETLWNKERDELQNKMKNVNDERNELVIKLKEYETKQGEFADDIERLTKEKEAATAKVAQLSHNYGRKNEELRSKYNAVTDECERLRQKEETWNKERDERNGLVIKLKEYETKQGEFTEDIERLTKEKEAASAKVAKLTETISGANDRYNALKAQYNKTKENMDAVNELNAKNENEIPQNEELRTKSNTMHAIDELLDKINDINDKSDQLRQKEKIWNKERDESQCKGLMIKLKEYETKQGELTEDIERLTKGKEAATTKLAKLKNHFKEKMEKLKQCKATITKSEAEKKKLQTLYNQMKTEYSTLDKKLVDKVNELQQKVDVANDANQKYNEMQQEYNKILDVNKSLEEELKNRQQSAKELTQTKTSIMRRNYRYNALEAQYNETKANMDAVKGLNANNENEIKRLQQELNEAKQSESNKQRKLKQLVEDHASAVEKHQILQMEYNQMKEQNTKYKENTAQIEQKIEAMDKQHTEDIDRITHKYKANIGKQDKASAKQKDELDEAHEFIKELIQIMLEEKDKQLNNGYDSVIKYGYDDYNEQQQEDVITPSGDLVAALQPPLNAIIDDKEKSNVTANKFMLIVALLFGFVASIFMEYIAQIM